MGPNQQFPSVVDANPKSKDWKSYVKLQASQQWQGGLLQGPLQVTFLFLVSRPQGHYGTGRNAGKLKDSAPRYPAKKPDLLKLARGVEDALTGSVYGDDAQIVEEILRKRYVRRPEDPPRVDIEVVELAPGTT